jgi:two-component system, cell cycle sensor histidine kinase and response regulator CckA
VHPRCQVPIQPPWNACRSPPTFTVHLADRPHHLTHDCYSTHGRVTSSRAGPPATVLVVEDEDALRAAIRRFLRDQGYTVLEAENGSTALQLLEGAAGEEVDLVLTDLRMPVMDGRQLASALARRRPSLPIVFMSGFTAQLMDLRLVSPNLAFLAKPFRNDELLAAVRSKLGS